MATLDPGGGYTSEILGGGGPVDFRRIRKMQGCAHGEIISKRRGVTLTRSWQCPEIHNKNTFGETEGNLRSKIFPAHGGA